MASWSIHENQEVTSKYQILGHIGSGSYADVYRGRRKADDLQVALKEVHDYQSACREIQALLRLRGYPNVVQLLDYIWLADESVVLVLEFLVSDLAAVIQRLRKQQQQPKATSHLGQPPPFEINLLPCETYLGQPYLLDAQEVDSSARHMVSDTEARSHLWAAAAPDGCNHDFHVESSSYCTAPTSYDVYNTEAAHMLAADDVFETDAPSRNALDAAPDPSSHQEESGTDEAAIEVEARVNDMAATIGDMGVASNHMTGVTLDAEASAPGIAVTKCDMAGHEMEAAPAEGQQQDILAAASISAESEVKGWMIQLLRGVASCHSVGVLHRDLKPSNMLISASGILKVADFGQARILEPPLGHVEGCSLAVVTNVDDMSPPEAPGSREDQSRIASTVATFHTETMDKSMDVEDIDTTSPPLFIKGAKMQSHENFLHVSPISGEKKISKPLSDSETYASKHITEEDVRTMIRATNSKETEGTVDSFVHDVQSDNLKIIGKALATKGAIYKETRIPQQSHGSAEGVEGRHSFGSTDEDDPRQVVWIDSDADPVWINKDVTRPEWEVGGNYNEGPCGIDETVSERSAEFSGGEAALNKEDVGSEFTGCVGTRWYRAPELLYGATSYGMGVDMWAVGCIFGELLLGQPVFPGCSDIDQLSRIVRALGNPNEECWPGVSNLPDYGKISFADDRSFSLRQHIKQGSEEAHDLLKRLIYYDPSSRMSADDALEHPFFHVQPFLTPASDLRVPSPGPVVDDDDDSMHSF